MTIPVRLSAGARYLSANSGAPAPVFGDIQQMIAKSSLNDSYRQLASLMQGFKEYGSPSQQSLETATAYLDEMFEKATKLGPWFAPHITLSENAEIVFEWWQDKRKITIYFAEESAEYLKVWGPDMETEMESGPLSKGWPLTSLWYWLQS